MQREGVLKIVVMRPSRSTEERGKPDNSPAPVLQKVRSARPAWGRGLGLANDPPGTESEPLTPSPDIFHKEKARMRLHARSRDPGHWGRVN